jgi:virginiamycin A acetyltransferase
MDTIERVIRYLVHLKVRFFGGTVSLGQGTYLNLGCEVRGEVELGNYCSIGRHVTLQAKNHWCTYPSQQNILYDEILEEPLGYDDERIIIGHDVWIGNRVTVLPGVTVGNGAILGANAVVTDNVEPYEIVGGVPARHIGWRFPEHVRKQLQSIEWWHWSPDRLKRNTAFFRKDLSSVPPDEDLCESIVE